MKLHYDKDRDSLSIDLSMSASVDARGRSDGMVVDYGAKGNVTGLDIQHASQHLDLSRIATMHLPLPVAV